MNTGIDFSRCPLLVIWETTRACALACKHCRANAIESRDPGELTTREGVALLEDIAGMGTPIVVFSGGDPLCRPDLEELIAAGKALRLRVGTIPAATPRLTLDRVRALRDAGLDQMALSLDGPTASEHDGFRGVPGSFRRVMRGAVWAKRLGLPLQINTVFAAWNFDRIDEMATLVERLGPVFWEVFSLVPVGRGTTMQGCTPEQHERLFEKLHALSQRASFVIKVTEAPHYRRYVEQHASQTPPTRPSHGGNGSGHPGGQRKPGIAFTRSGVNAGQGFCFVDHVGDVYPSGFLPISGGNVRDTRVSEIYRTAPLFRKLRSPELLSGRCGACEYKDACGGSRSKAYAVTGDYLAEDPSCGYQPDGYTTVPAAEPHA